MPNDIPKEVTTALLVAVMKLQKQYAHELSGARNDRRAELKKLLNKIAAERLDRQ